MIVARWRGFRLFPGLAFMILLGGCQSQAAKEFPPEARHLRHAAFLCRDYYSATGNRATKISEVQDWAVEEGKAAAEDFVSTRDNEPYGIMIFPVGNQLLVYEQVGENGKHFLFHGGNVSEVTKEQLDGRLAYLNRTPIMRGDPSKKPQKKEDESKKAGADADH
jgi:hypothetical protein